MSTSEALNSKEEDDLLNDNLDEEIPYSTSKSGENNMQHTTKLDEENDKLHLEGQSKESQIIFKSLEDEICHLKDDKSGSKGDVSNEKSEPNVTEASNDKDDLVKPVRLTEDLSDDEEMELKWEDDDGNTLTPDNGSDSAEVAKKNDKNDDGNVLTPDNQSDGAEAGKTNNEHDDGNILTTSDSAEAGKTNNDGNILTPNNQSDSAEAIKKNDEDDVGNILTPDIQSDSAEAVNKNDKDDDGNVLIPDSQSDSAEAGKDDDGNVLTPDNQSDSAKAVNKNDEDDVGYVLTPDNPSDSGEAIEKNDDLPLEFETDEKDNTVIKESEKSNTELLKTNVDVNIGAEETADVTENILEDKLLEEDVETESKALANSAELNEEDLLKDDSEPEEMDVDSHNIVELNKETTSPDTMNKDTIEKSTDADSSGDGEKPNSPLGLLQKTINDDINKNLVNADESIIEKDDEITLTDADNITLDESDVKRPQGIHKPDAMLEIPTQELVDIDNELDSFDSGKKSNSNDSINEEYLDNGSKVAGDGDELQNDEGNKSDRGDSEMIIIDKALAVTPLEVMQPTTSSNKMLPDDVSVEHEVPEMSDSLGLLAESCRVLDDDEDQPDDDDDDDDEDFDNDESSNQVSAEHSEDSNPPHSETDQIKDEITLDDGILEDVINKCEEDFEFTNNDVEVDDEKSDDLKACDDTSMLPEIHSEPVLPIEHIKKEKDIKIESIKKEDALPIEHIKKEKDIKIESIKKEDGNKVNLIKMEKEDNSNLNKNIKKEKDDDDVTKSKVSLLSENKRDVVKHEKLDTIKTEDGAKETKKEYEEQKTTEASKLLQKSSPKSSPSKLKNLTIEKVQSSNFVNIVDLEESSSDDETQEKEKPSRLKELLQKDSKPLQLQTPPIDVVTTSRVYTTDNTSSQPSTQKATRSKTVEGALKKLPSTEALGKPEVPKTNDQTSAEKPSTPRLSLEIFSLDSDEEETTVQEPKQQSEKSKPQEPKPETEVLKPEIPEIEKPKKKRRKCINYTCSSGLSVFRLADTVTSLYYDAMRIKRPMVCQVCADAVVARNEKLADGIKDVGTPLLDLNMTNVSQDLVEILDSESDDEDTPMEKKEPIGVKAAEMLEQNLSQLLNKTWKEYKMDDRLKVAEDEVNAEIGRMEKESKELNDMLDECQRVTDKLRRDLYATFKQRIQELPSLVIYETPDYKYIGPEYESAVPVSIIDIQTRQQSTKRKSHVNPEPPAKRPAIPLGYAPLHENKPTPQAGVKSEDPKVEEDKDISVVKLSAESAPADLPPPGELSRPPLRVGMPVYAMKNAFGPWFKGRVAEIMPKNNSNQFTMCRVKFDHKIRNNSKVLPARCIAYADPSDVRMIIGTRLIALFKDSNKRESYYSGVVAEIPNPVNSYRYLVFFDDGYAQYVEHTFTRLVCECSPLVWEEVHPFSREFVRGYLMAYPERPMVRLHEGQHLKTEWDGKWWSSRVARVDASLAQVVFIEDGRREWVYRGSTRLAPLYLELQAAERHRPRPMPRTKQLRSNMPYVEYTRSDEQSAAKPQDQALPQPAIITAVTTQQQNEEIRRQRAVAKKSTALPPVTAAPTVPTTMDSMTSRVVYYTPKNAVRPYKLVPHKCSPKCKRNDVLSLKELRTYNPLAKPLLSGWERQIVRYKGQKEVMYRAPCGRRLRNMSELHRYLRDTDSELPVDLFDFYHATHCLAEFVLNKCLVGKKDLSHGKENVPVPCVNYYDDSLPEFCSYNTERTPTSGVPLNLDPDFLCGCDCTDDCQDKSKCACWKMTLEGAKTIGLEGTNVGYEFKRLPEPLPSGIYECNSRCKCKETCLNRVAQHPLQLKLQVFKTLNRGWGIRALNDVPKGSFLCVYAGNLLTDATANLDGLNEGDEYLAELDYIEVVEQMKEGYEEDIPEADKKLDKKDSLKTADPSDEEPSSSSEDDGNDSKTDKEDDDFRPPHIGLGVMEFNKRLRKRSKNKKEKTGESKVKDKKETNPDEDCITISDDDEVREPSRFTAQPGMSGSDFISKYRSVRTLFGEDEACYIMDAKVQGNIGRYLNHSCSPNVFVQNVFVDTHDPRFPWVAFFALSHIKAGTELTWNYNYDVGSVPGKVLYCYCEAPNCRRRLL